MRFDESPDESRDRRRAAAAANWRQDAALDAMRALVKQNPDHFDELYGPRARIQVGLYESAATAAGVDLDDEDTES